MFIIKEKAMQQTDISITSVYQGQPFTLVRENTESLEELHFRLMHSLVANSNPVQTGIMDTYSVYGMQFAQHGGYSPNINKTMIIRRVIEEDIFRQALLGYIQKYVDAKDNDILRIIGKESIDIVVAEHLSQLPKKRGFTNIKSVSAGTVVPPSLPSRVQSRVYDVMNFLSRIPHVPITQYLDYGTGDGTVAAGIANALNTIPDGQSSVIPKEKVEAMGVDIFPMKRPIPTLVIKDPTPSEDIEYILPKEWEGKFQLITAFSVFHHVKAQVKIIRELYRVLAPGGLLIMREHDYRDMTPSSFLRDTTIERSLYPCIFNGQCFPPDNSDAEWKYSPNPFRNFLDAIHIAAAAVGGEDEVKGGGKSLQAKSVTAALLREYWALYRSRFEWHSIMLKTGFQHTCTDYFFSPTTMSQMLRKEPLMSNWKYTPQPEESSAEEGKTAFEEHTSNTWIQENPQRLYHSVFMKPLPTDIKYSGDLVLEYKVNRAASLSSFFPLRSKADSTNKGNILSEIKPGINYDEEILSYMTPWYAAQNTSRIIYSLMRKEYGEAYEYSQGTNTTTSESTTSTRISMKKYKLFDGTGGAGGNVISLLSNRDITTIYVYERISTFFKYILNNIQLYTGSKAIPLGERNINRESMGEIPTISNAYSITHTIEPIRRDNVTMGKPVEQTIYLYNRDFPLKEIISGTHGPAPISGAVLFLDVPWVSEGCGYKLSEYTYSGVTLERLASMVIKAGALMVVYKLPPGYKLSIQHNEYKLGKETIYVVLPKNIEPTVTAQGREITSTGINLGEVSQLRVQGSSPALELIRYKLMDHLRTQFRQLLPNIKPNDYYMWIYERIMTYGTNSQNAVLDPIIPATPSLVSSNIIMEEMYYPDIEYGDLIDLVENQYPELISSEGLPLSFEDEKIAALKLAVAHAASQKQGQTTQKVMQQIDSLARNIYQLFKDASIVQGISATVTSETRGNMVYIYIKPNALLQRTLSSLPPGNMPNMCNKVSTGISGTIPCVSIATYKFQELKGRYIGIQNMLEDLSAMLIRYSILMEPSKEASFAGVNLHAAIPPSLFRTLTTDGIKVTTECFASPLNATLKYYMSAFPDTDMVFGSIGSFFVYNFSNGGLPDRVSSTTISSENAPKGSYEANPPFTESMIQSMINRVESLLTQADTKGTPLSFFIIVPDWTLSSVDQIKKSKWKRFELFMPESSHSYIAGQQHLLPSQSSFVASFKTYISILQSQEGAKVYPIPVNFSTIIFNSFH